MFALTLLSLAVGLPTAHSWTLSLPSPPAACEPFQLTFSGGVAPYQFTFLRLPSQNASLPLDQWGAGHAIIVNETTSPASVTLPWAANDPFVVIGSDATGFATGGTTPVMNMQSSDLAADSNASCLQDSTNNTYVQHVQSLTTGGMQMCERMSGVFTDVKSPVSVSLVVPDGSSMRYSSASVSQATTVDFSWYLTVPADNHMFFFVEDGNGPLFVSTLYSVVTGASTSCPQLAVTGGLLPATTGPLPMATAEPVSPNWAPGGSSQGPKTGAIVGGVIGGLVFVAAIAGLVMFMMHRYNWNQRLLREQAYGIAAYGPAGPTMPVIEGGVDSKKLLDEASGMKA
ncbi:hypothetical protein CALCODRAFT_522078 [Calocera cornea HHB12733]|uniref:Mid2 domain-containing protein n=1 Tax=Calocera cornea HHB12733 TaxID=1353952 RepID=A0A165C3J8_9BASI|nr:hypothetical protein CALCODRAFT_522078 [Calocera cornea HHB12733]